MNKFNPTALAFWGLCSAAGWLIGDVRGAVIGLVVALSASLLVALFER